ncbi:hydroxymethylbilane synthase [Thermodesulfobacterium sp. TA1]|uniref:hydroxymethylbilane synthase n=1 Tax=Thermodesulfobacterium sp. TA1 TaxID=2234087 RepID=UPI0012324CCF|nr:hydroxymethylbilane synthase [Thermodesulfobacterium sp. TA1]QER41942.1 hydroxymethylbilane synthase [Thermodesulfobacterium sp. TA1]
MEIRVGTRGSKLALAQTEWVIARLKKVFPDLTFEKVIIKTTGDKILDAPLSKIGGKGLFVKEIEEALLRGEIDLAVHSLKDVPSFLAEGLEISCIPERESPFDVWVSDYAFSELPPNSKVGTSSLRRMTQLKKLRKDLEILPLRGNVDTRLRKWREGQYAGIVLAEAGLKRLSLSIEYTRFTIDELIPAVGQGALAIETRKDDLKIKTFLSALHHKPTEICIRAERAFLKTLEGGCQVPLGAYAWLEGDELFMVGFISDLEGERFYKYKEKGDPQNPEALGERLAKHLLSLGGDKILAEIYQGI